MRRTLDPSICSHILRRHPTSMLERFAGLDRQQLWLSAIVAAELRLGAARLGPARFAAAVEAWLAGRLPVARALGATSVTFLVPPTRTSGDRPLGLSSLAGSGLVQARRFGGIDLPVVGP